MYTSMAPLPQLHEQENRFVTMLFICLFLFIVSNRQSFPSLYASLSAYSAVYTGVRLMIRELDKSVVLDRCMYLLSDIIWVQSLF